MAHYRQVEMKMLVGAHAVAVNGTSIGIALVGGGTVIWVGKIILHLINLIH